MSTVLPPPTPRATIDDLMRVEGKAELIGGRIVYLMPTGVRPGVVSFRIARRLADYADAAGRGLGLPDGVGFAVPELSSGRESFCPDAAYYTGPSPPTSMRFADGPPAFAAEVRSENDYGPAAERDMAAKRADYFEAGTLVVWDADPEAGTVTKYTAADPTRPTTFGPGQEADADPATPGWRLPIDWLMR